MVSEELESVSQVVSKNKIINKSFHVVEQECVSYVLSIPNLSPPETITSIHQ